MANSNFTDPSPPFTYFSTSLAFQRWPQAVFLRSFGYNLNFMDTPEKDFKKDLKQQFREQRSHSGRALAGLILIGVGAILLADKFGVYVPFWVFKWPVILIVIGLFIGAKNSFRSSGWIIMVIVGGAFLMEDLLPGLAFHQYIWPLLIIAVGLLMIVRPRRSKKYWRSWENYASQPRDLPGSTEDYLQSTTVFSSDKKKIISKDFKGGEITSFFGGINIDFTQADINGVVTMDINNVFSGTKLIIPPHWHVRSEVVCVFGAIEDKRKPMNGGADPTKVLRLIGSCVFAGVDIKSY
jgi:hypothetical protein